MTADTAAPSARSMSTASMSSCGSTFPSDIWESTKTGVAPVCTTAFADAAKVMLGSTTTVPGLAPTRAMQRAGQRCPTTAQRHPPLRRARLLQPRKRRRAARGVPPNRTAVHPARTLLRLQVTSACDSKIRDIQPYSFPTTCSHSAALSCRPICAGQSLPRLDGLGVPAPAHPAGAEEQQRESGEECDEADGQRAGDAGTGVGEAAVTARSGTSGSCASARTRARSGSAATAGGRTSATSAATGNDGDGETGRLATRLTVAVMVKVPVSLIVTGTLKLPLASAVVGPGASTAATLRRPDGPVMVKAMVSPGKKPCRRR